MDRELRNFQLRQGLFTSAASFDLTQAAERSRSNVELVKLFHEFVGMIKPKCCIEVGAFTAEFSVQVKQRLPATHVIAFEANPHNYDEIRNKRDFAKLGVDYRHAAISSTSGTTEFFLMKKMPNSQQRPNVAPDNSLKPRNRDGFEYEKLSVRSIALGDMLVVNEFVADDFCLWIDVEGAVRDVLTGADPIMNRVAAVLVEVEDHAYWQNQWLSGDVINFMADRDFYPIARDYEYADQYNIVFLNYRYLQHHQYGSIYSQYVSACGKRPAG